MSSTSSTRRAAGPSPGTYRANRSPLSHEPPCHRNTTHCGPIPTWSRSVSEETTSDSCSWRSRASISPPLLSGSPARRPRQKRPIRSMPRSMRSLRCTARSPTRSGHGHRTRASCSSATRRESGTADVFRSNEYGRRTPHTCSPRSTGSMQGWNSRYTRQEPRSSIFVHRRSDTTHVPPLNSDGWKESFRHHRASLSIPTRQGIAMQRSRWSACSHRTAERSGARTASNADRPNANTRSRPTMPARSAPNHHAKNPNNVGARKDTARPVVA